MPGGTEDMTYSVNIAIRIVTAIILAVFFGSGSVVAFNNIRAKWFDFASIK